MKEYYKMGDLLFSFEGISPLREVIADELVSLKTLGSQAAVDIEFVFGTCPKLPVDACIESRVSSWKDGFRVNAGALRYQVSVEVQPMRVTVEETDIRTGLRRNLPARLFQWTDWNFLTRRQTIAKNFMYDAFDYLTQITQLKYGQTYVHASGFEKDEVGVAIFALGGIGKTTSMLKMVREDGWRFLSDDLAMIDSKGILWRSPKRMQIYAYNLINQSALEKDLFRGRSVIDRLSWWLFKAVRGVSKVRRRVSAEELFGTSKVATCAKLHHAIFAERVNNENFSFASIEPSEVAERMAPIVTMELSPYSTIESIIRGSGNFNLLPSSSDMERIAKDAINNALESSSTWLWKIPNGALPEQIYDDLKSRLIEIG